MPTNKIIKNAVIIIPLISIVFTSCTHHSYRNADHHNNYQHDSSHHSFEDVKKYEKMFESPERSRWQKPDEVVKKMAIKKGHKIADIGAGTGYFTRRFAAATGSMGEAYGYDIEPGMVNYMKMDSHRLNLMNYKGVLIKPENPDLPKKYFDIIFMCNVYHHIKNRSVYFKELKKSLVKNGRLIIVDFYKKKSTFGPPVEMKIKREIMVQELNEAGFKVSRSLDFLPDQYFLEFKAE